MKRLLLVSGAILMAPLVLVGQTGTKRALLIGISHYIPSESVQRFIPPTYKVDSRFNPGMSWNNLPAALDDVNRMSTLVLQTIYGFQPANISILPEDQATHDGILHALDQLVAETKPGDTVVFYFSGHGSQRVDTLSSKNNRDQTIVPVDAWKGDFDVRDKELAVRFNHIVYDKKAHLTAIFDTCESATQGRGIVPVISHALAYDDRDVALDKKAHPSQVVVEADLKQIPQKGNAVILAAAAPERSAYEARLPDDDQWHGIFTWALIHTLQSSPQLRSADDVMSAVQAQINANTQAHPEILFQQVSVEGQHNQSLFGDPVPPHPLHATVTAIPTAGDEHPLWKLEPGSAGGFAAGSEFEALDSKAQKSILRIVSVDGPTISTAEHVDGDADIKVGQTFALKSIVYPQAAQLTVFVSAPMSEASPAAVKTLFPGLAWVADPSLQPIDYLVVHEDRGWVAYQEDGTVTPAGQPIKGAAWLVLPPPQPLIAEMQTFQPYTTKAYTFTSRLIEANYILATRTGAGQQAEFALIDPVVLAPRKPGAFVHSPTTTPPQPGEGRDIDLRLSHAGSDEAVCRNDISLPVRTAWLHEEPNDKQCDGLAFALTRRIVRLGKVRSLLTGTAQAPVLANWPYMLAVTGFKKADPAPKLPLHPGSTFAISLKAEQATLDAHAPDRKYLYLFGASCAGDLNLYYPSGELNGVSEQPIEENGHWQANVTLLSVGSPGISYPLGADTFFLMALPEQRKMLRPETVTDDGNICTAGSRGAFMDMNALLSALNKESAVQKRQSDWTMQQIVVPSRPQ